MNNYLILVLIGIFFLGCQVRVKTGSESATDDLISINNLRVNMEFLASDELEGREAGSTGEKVASKFIAAELRKYGVSPFRSEDFFQNIELRVIRFSNQSTFSIIGKNGQAVLALLPEKNFVGSTRYYEKIDTTAKLVFAGYGIIAEEYNYNDYEDLDVKGKIVLIYHGEPESNDSTYFKGEKRTTYSSTYKKTNVAAQQGALAVIALSGMDKRFSWESIINYVKKGKYQLMDQPVMQKSNRIPFVAVNEESFSQLIDFSSFSYQDIKNNLDDDTSIPRFELDYSAKINWMFDTTGTVEVRNVIGFIEGSDPALKHEYIGVGAHYDHVGIGSKGVYNGADDNASGTVALLEIARAFAERKENDRSVLITFHTAEEKGLLGSKHLVRDTSITNNMNGHINMDMIGRGSSDSIYCLGSDKLSSELYDLVEEVNAEGVNMYLDYRLNDPSDPQRLYYRSDHFSYAKNKIPSVFFFDYEMEDYHKVSDDVVKINYLKIQKIARLVYEIALKSANREAKFRLDNNVEYKQ